MSHPRAINRLFLAMVGATALAICARADDVPSFSGVDQPMPLEVSVKKGEIISSEQVQRAFINAGTNQFMIVAPGGTRVDHPASGRVTLIPTDYRYYLSFRILGAPDAGAEGVTADYYRGQVLGRFPGATITDESSSMAGNHSGPSFSLQWVTTGGEAEMVHVAYIPCPAGVIEFSLVVDQKKSAEGEANFRSVLASLRSNETGKLEYAAFPVGS